MVGLGGGPFSSAPKIHVPMCQGIFQPLDCVFFFNILNPTTGNPALGFGQMVWLGVFQ